MTEPRKGIWHAQFNIDGPDPVIGELTHFIIYDTRWDGRITRGGVYAGQRYVYIEGGKGDLRGILPAKDYQQQPLRIPLQDILGKVNMNLAIQNDSIINERLTTWVRVQAAASNQISSLVNHFGDYYWRILPDATVRIFNNGQNYAQKIFEEFIDYQLMHYDPVWKCSTIALGGRNRMITHSSTFLAKDADYITHTITENKLRTKVWERDP